MAKRDSLMVAFDVDGFEHRVNEALSSLRRVLDTARQSPVAAGEVQHSYADKFWLAESLTKLAVASLINCLAAMGLDEAALRALAAASRKGQRITLRFRAVESCTRERTTKRDEQVGDKVVTTQGLLGKRETKVVTTITEHFWKVGLKWSLTAFTGAEEGAAAEPIRLGAREASGELITRAEAPPMPERVECPLIDVDLTWLLQRLGDGLEVGFAIDRDAAGCNTPRRNKEVDDALAAAAEIRTWCDRVHRYFVGGVRIRLLQPTERASLDQAALSGVGAAAIFVPVLPLFQPEEGRAEQPATGEPSVPLDVLGAVGTVTLSAGSTGGANSAELRVADLHRLLAEERRQMEAKWAALGEAFAAPTESSKLISAREAQLCAALAHGRAALEQYSEAITYVEALLKKQLVAAVGRELTPDDFTKYMRYHATKLYRAEFMPQPFCFAVRRPEHSPEGTVSIESEVSDAAAPTEPISTLQRCLRGPSPPMSFALDAATRVHFTGDRYLHAYLPHQFASVSGPPLWLTARARQFSCFMLVAGRLGPGRTFEPKHALIVRNKDDVKIPLMLEQLPTAKEFKDAISSLSPEQQRFAKAYRAMQLEGSVFGLLVVQLKPQLERLLGLPVGSLTKEIKLTQQLLELFMEYQIPSDLLSYDGEAGAETPSKLAAVKAHVQAIYDTLDEAKRSEIDAARQQHAFAHPGVKPTPRAQADEEEEDEEEEMAGAWGLEEATAPEGAMMNLKSCGLADDAMRFGSAPRAKSKMSAPRGKGGGGGGMGLMHSMGRSARRSSRGGGGPQPPGAMMGGAIDCAMAAPPMPPAVQCAAAGAPPNSAVRSASVAAAASSPPPPQQHSAAPQQPSRDASFAADGEGEGEGGALESADHDLDFTSIPSVLDAQFEALDVDSALRPTLINVGEEWSRTSQKALLSTTKATATLRKDELRLEKQKAFDLLDALSRSGALPIECCELHVVVAATHCFDTSLMDTVIVKNVNPIEKLERSSLIVAATIQGVPAAELIRHEEYRRVATWSAPALLAPPQDAEIE